MSLLLNIEPFSPKFYAPSSKCMDISPPIRVFPELHYQRGSPQLFQKKDFVFFFLGGGEGRSTRGREGRAAPPSQPRGSSRSPPPFFFFAGGLTFFMAAAMSSYLSACSASRAFCTSCSRSTIFFAFGAAAGRGGGGFGGGFLFLTSERKRERKERLSEGRSRGRRTEEGDWPRQAGWRARRQFNGCCSLSAGLVPHSPSAALPLPLPHARAAATAAVMTAALPGKRGGRAQSECASASPPPFHKPGVLPTSPVPPRLLPTLRHIAALSFATGASQTAPNCHALLSRPGSCKKASWEL